MEQERILVVEDEKIIALDLKRRLEKFGYLVVGLASRADEAVELAGNERPDLVLMDIRLKGDMDGIEAAKEINERFNIPVIYLTAHSDDETLKRAKQTDPYGYILKPFEEDDLRTTIELALHRSKMEKTDE